VSDKTSKPFSENTRKALEDYRDRTGLSTSAIAAGMGYSPATLSKYLSGKPDGDVQKLEALIEDVLAAERRQKASINALFQTAISEEIARRLEKIRKTGDVALLHGKAGIGKTCAIDLYAKEHPTTIAMTATIWRKNPVDVEGMLFNSLETRTWNGRQKRGDYVVDRLKDSGRLIIVDNAHRLKVFALAFLFDFHDLTGCPIALVGNPEVLTTIKLSDQMFSRVGQGAMEIRVKKDKRTAEAAHRILVQLLPEAADDLEDLVYLVAENHGHFRAVRKQLILTREIKENSPKPISWEDAFRSAHLELIRDYSLS